jgi:hypothetical protein
MPDGGLAAQRRLGLRGTKAGNVKTAQLSARELLDNKQGSSAGCDSSQRGQMASRQTCRRGMRWSRRSWFG